MRFATPSSSAPVGRWRNGARPITPPSRLRWKGRRSCWWKGSREERTEIRGQRSEDRRQKTEDRRQKTEDRRQKTEDRRQKTEDRRQKTEDRRQPNVYQFLLRRSCIPQPRVVLEEGAPWVTHQRQRIEFGPYRIESAARIWEKCDQNSARHIEQETRRRRTQNKVFERRV